MASISPYPFGRGHWVISPEESVMDFIGGYRGDTRTHYQKILRRWLTFCQETQLDPWQVSRIHIEAWIATMPPQSATAHASVVCAFYRDAHGKGITAMDLAWGVRRPRVGRPKSGTYATPQELARILDKAQALPADDRAIITHLVLAGPRLGETLGLDVSDVDSEPPLRVTYHRKNAHVDTVSMPPRVAKEIRGLLAKRSTGPLYRRKGRRMKADQVRALVARLRVEADCEQHLTPHSLRRSFVTLARDLDVADEDIMAMTGHSDPTMIDHYDRGRRQRDGVAGAAVEAALEDLLP